MARGGYRPGAGRPPGIKETRPRRSGHKVMKEKAARALAPGGEMSKRYKDEEIPAVPSGHRVPADAPNPAKAAADFAFQVYIDVAAGRMHSKRAAAMLKAAKEMRNEICGPIAQKHEVDLKGRLEMLLTQSLETESPGAQSAPGETGRAEGEATGPSPAPPSAPEPGSPG